MGAVGCRWQASACPFRCSAESLHLGSVARGRPGGAAEGDAVQCPPHVHPPRPVLRAWAEVHLRGECPWFDLGGWKAPEIFWRGARPPPPMLEGGRDAVLFGGVQRANPTVRVGKRGGSCVPESGTDPELPGG